MPEQMPPVQIINPMPSGPGVPRRYLVLEISGGDEATAKSWYSLAEMELEHMVDLLKALLHDSPARARKNPPQVVLHKPPMVEA